MPELKFSALDTSLAMEEVKKTLGPDALILSTHRRDGMIEIVATNDPDQVEAANLKSSEKRKARQDALILSAVDMIDNESNFSDLIDVETAKYQDAEDFPDTAVSINIDRPALNSERQPFTKMDLEPAFNRVATELLAFFDGARSITSSEDDSISTRSKMQMMGFSKKSISKLMNDTDQSIDIYGAIKQFSKIIVQGKNRDFDDSQVILVCGPEKSGKTVLSQKLAKFLPTKLPVQSNKVIADTLTGDLTSLFKSDLDSNITSLFRKRQDVDLDHGRLIIDYEGSLDILSAVLDKFDRLEQKPNVSVVYALEVGKSYNAVKKLLESSQIPNLFIAFTKMDLLEVSVSELSAVSDLDQKIQFFSGLKISEDGLDFAKVSVVEDFLGNLAKEEGL